MENLRVKILKALERRGPMSLEEILGELMWRGDLKPLRRVIADMIKEGVLVKEPNYQKRKLVYKVGRKKE